MDKRVEAIRAHKLVGRGSCSSIDECYSDEDLITQLNENGITEANVAGALKWALDGEELFLEQGLNQRFGEDDDEQLKIYKDWKAAREAYQDFTPEQVATFLANVEANREKAHQARMNDMARDHQDFMKRAAEDQRECDLLNRGH